MTKKERNRRVKAIIRRYEEVNILYIEHVASRVARIGLTDAEKLDEIAILAALAIETAEINARAASTAQQAIPEMYSLYQDELDGIYTGTRFGPALKEKPLPYNARRGLNDAVQGISRQTAEKVLDLSGSLAMGNYRRAVDRAVLAARGPSGSRSRTTQQIIREVGYEGLQVEYESGHKRRLTAAIRMSVLDGIKALTQNVNDILSEALGYDAKEISAHPNSAPDHEPLQGRVFALDEFHKLQDHMACKDIDGRRYPAQTRAIGEMNCRHIAHGFSTVRSKRRYTNDQLEQMANNNARGCVVDGQRYTLYEAQQLARAHEVEAERLQGVVAAAKAAGDADLQKVASDRIRQLQATADRYADAVDRGMYEGAKDRIRI